MSYDDDAIGEERGFRAEGDSEDELEPLEEGAINDFRFDEEADEDPDDKYH